MSLHSRKVKKRSDTKVVRELNRKLMVPGHVWTLGGSGIFSVLLRVSGVGLQNESLNVGFGSDKGCSLNFANVGSLQASSSRHLYSYGFRKEADGRRFCRIQTPHAATLRSPSTGKAKTGLKNPLLLDLPPTLY